MELKTVQEYLYFKDFTFVLSSFSVLLLTYAFSAIVRKVLTWKKDDQKRIPGPVGLPFVGYLPFLGKEPHKTFWNLRKKYGDVMSVYLGPRYTVVLNGYEVAKQVYDHPGSLDRPAKGFDYIGPAGFGVENGKLWIEQRRFSMLALRDVGIGKDYWTELVMEELSSLIKKFKELNGKEYDIADDLLYSINASLLSLLIGRRMGEDEKEKNQIASEYNDAALGKAASSNPILIIPGLRRTLELLKVSTFVKKKDIIHQFQSFLNEEIENHKTAPLLRDIPDFINSYLKKLSELSESKTKDHTFSEKELRGNLCSLFMGGSDTIFSSLSYLFRLMAKHKNIQNKVYEELIDVLGTDGQAKYDERDMIPYTFAVMMDSQRLLSNMTLSPFRTANQDIPVKEYIIPKGTDIVVNFWGLNYDPAYYEKPNEFHPEHFLTDGGAKLIKNPPSFSTFSFGRRKCPGEIIAWKEMLYYFTDIIRKFEVSMPPGVEAKFELTDSLVRQLIRQPLCFKERNISKKT